ncbi:alanyl-tRNA synthetase, class IIc [Actinidia rufa]|uniref:Alanine--tRNA ligase n=1 Tax=Actinidia rufa TaxID=165716 RepID=A0A7J0ETT9_9ERIC|nr:alanyl-tRNA synthetase, class IIc [Actinidia rufa]
MRDKGKAGEVAEIWGCGGRGRLAEGRQRLDWVDGKEEIKMDDSGLIIQKLALVRPTSFSSKHSNMKGTGELPKDMTSSGSLLSASIQPVIEELVESKSKDLLTSGDSIRRRFLDFYASRGHKVLPSASLVPDDPTVLLTIAGMLQFKPIFLGKVPRQVPRATTAQRCIRTNDIENVGRTSRHHTFFEMFGNFSFGDYFKKEAIKWAWELSTFEFGLPFERLWISVYEYDTRHLQYGMMSSEDVKSFMAIQVYTAACVPVEFMMQMGEEDNFWTSGVTGPCGPCSEIYYNFRPERGHSDVHYYCDYDYHVDVFHLPDLGDDTRVLVECIDDMDADSLKSAADYLVDTLQDPTAVVLGSSPGEGKVSLIAAFTPGVADMGIQAGKFIGPIAKLCGGGGGGRPNFSQAGGRKPENWLSALEKAQSELVSILSEKAS